MSKEYASLLAQVIPVFALALGLEMRSMTERAMKEFAGLTAQGLTLEKALNRWIALFSAMTVAQGQLVAIEIKALNVASGSATFWHDITLPVVIIVVVGLPIASSFYSLMVAGNHGDRAAARRFVLIGLVAVFGLGVLEYFLFS